MTLYWPSQDLEPRQHLRAHLDARLPGIQVPIVCPAGYKEGQSIPDHALPRFQGNPTDNFKVLSPVPYFLHGHWIQGHQSHRWEGNTDGDIRLQETHLQEVILGYAAKSPGPSPPMNTRLRMD